MDFVYKHSRVKQYLKDRRGYRIETVINKPSDIGGPCPARAHARAGRQGTRGQRPSAYLERAGQGCAIGDDLFDRLHQPLTEGQRTGAFRFGDQRAMALAGALCCVIHAVTSFTNKSLRGLVAGLLGRDYSANQMSYDLRRLRLHGLIERVPAHQHLPAHPPKAPGSRSSTPNSTPGLLHPLLDAAHQPPAPTPTAPRARHHRPNPQRLHQRRATRHRRMKTRHKIQGLRPQEIQGLRPQENLGSGVLPEVDGNPAVFILEHGDELEASSQSFEVLA